MIQRFAFMRRSRSIVLLGFASVLLVAAGCSDKDPDPPAKLGPITTKLDVKSLWSTGLGGDAKRLRLALHPVVVDQKIYAASHAGEVVALSEANGRRIWSIKSKLPLSAGPEVSGDALVVGSSDGDILALEAATGKERWRKTIASEVLAQPLIVNDIVVVRTVDGHLQGLSLQDGSTKWTVDEQVPRLTLRGTAPPILAKDRIVAGFDNGRVIAVDPRNGDTLWGTVVNAPHGRTELERLSDIDSPARVQGDDIFVVGFQGRIAMLALDSGQIWWAHDASSYRGFAMDEDTIYLTNSDSGVVAMKRADGTVLWEQKGLHKRGLTAPAVDGNALVVGDFDGYLHWLDKSTGEIIARAKAGGDRITNSPVATDAGVFVETDSGKLLAFRSSPRAEKNRSAKNNQ
jgi:outer membrane protein assembly factor BamB